MRRLLRTGIAAAVVVVAGVAAWVVFFQDDAPPPPSLDAVDSTGATGAEGDSIDGTWTVVTGTDTYAGYRIDETFAGVNTPVEPAVARTGSVTGSVDIAGTTVEDAAFTVDMTTLASDPCNVPAALSGLSCDRRDSYLKTASLETDSFPEASFALDEPVELGTEPAVGQQVEIEAAGQLTLHGVTKAVTLALQARWDGTQLVVVGQLPILLADYDIAPPDVPVVSVEDNGQLEVSLVLARS